MREKMQCNIEKWSYDLTYNCIKRQLKLHLERCSAHVDPLNHGRQNLFKTTVLSSLIILKEYFENLIE